VSVATSLLGKQVKSQWAGVMAKPYGEVVAVGFDRKAGDFYLLVLKPTGGFTTERVQDVEVVSE
jgi:hypothetical protein